MTARILLLFMMMMPLIAKAQFTIVDKEDHEPLPGVYVFGANGTLIDMSNEKGEVTKATSVVTLSMLSYAPVTVDAEQMKGSVVELSSQPFELGEVVVQKMQYYKISGTFRDVVVNFDKLVMYREGLMDFYVDKNTGKTKRRIRACRQYEHPDLRNFEKNDSLNMGYCKLFDLGNLTQLGTAGSEEKGDTTLIWATRGKKVVKDGVMMFRQNGLYRKVIDGTKFVNKTSSNFLGLRQNFTKAINDWTFREPKSTMESLVAHRQLIAEDMQWGKKKPVIKIETTKDFVVNDVTYLTKKQASEEMKDKDTEKGDFHLPNCLPALPKSLTDQIQTMKRTKRRDM